MKICVIGAPSTGKSVFARTLSAEMTRQGMNCELVQEYASSYIQDAGTVRYAWEQLVISLGQSFLEAGSIRDHVVTDGSVFACYIYAQRLAANLPADGVGEKQRALLDILRLMARRSLLSYDLIFFLSYVFPPHRDGVRSDEHLARTTCQTINDELEAYMRAERVEYHRLKANDSRALAKALMIVEQRLLIQPAKAAIKFDPVSVEG